MLYQTTPSAQSLPHTPRPPPYWPCHICCYRPVPSPTLTHIKRLWTSIANILARRNLPEIVRYSMKSSLREDSKKYWNFSENSLWAEISNLQYRCCTKQLLLLKVYHKLLDLHHFGNVVCDAVVLLFHQPLALQHVSELQMRISWLVGISQKWFDTPWKALCERILKSIETFLGTTSEPRYRI